jgi:hypothetical protein
VLPSNLLSNVMEANAAQSGRYVWYTGNWFAARSTNAGQSWLYVNPYQDFPDFCCDQWSVYDPTHDTFYWIRLTNIRPGVSNSFRLSVVSRRDSSSLCNYDITPGSVSADWAGWVWDYAHLELGANNLYITWNLYQGTTFQRSVILRFPLDALDTCAGFSYRYVWTSAFFNLVQVQGAHHVMYFASNWALSAPLNRLRIFRWPENTNDFTFVDRTVPAWTFTNRNAVCGPAPGNWAGRTDQRLLTGARYMYNSLYPGRWVVGWWWNVAQGGSFPWPYVEAAAFYEDTLLLVPGFQGRPSIWSSSVCYLYPSVSPNVRGDFSVVFNYGTLIPHAGFAIADPYVPAPPGYFPFGAVVGSGRPADNAWGDYNSVRPYWPTGLTWCAAAHYISGGGVCTACSTPAFWNFGRERDRLSWEIWQSL